MSAVMDYDTHRFAVGVAMSGTGCHAVDRDSVIRSRDGAPVEVFSLCGKRVQIISRLGPFTYANRLLGTLRCERCSWVVALNRGTVEQEIELYVADAGGDPRGVLLREIFTSILADATPGPEAVAGHRSDLLAHAARHRPTLIKCGQCDRSAGSAGVDELSERPCPYQTLVCRECSFTAGTWAGRWEGVATGECVVTAPCSVLAALADHYEIAPRPRRGQ